MNIGSNNIRLRSLIAVWLAFAGLLASIVASHALRRAAVPSEFGYMPAECSIIVAVGDVKSLWRGIGRHFGFLLAQDDSAGKQGVVSKGLITLRDFLKEKGKPVDSLADLSAYGVDIRKGALLAVDRVEKKGTPHFVLLLHVMEGSANYMTFVKSLLSANISKEQENAEAPSPSSHVFALGENLLMAHPEPGIVLLSNDRQLLLKSLMYSAENYSRLIANDRFYNGIRDARVGRLMRGPRLFFWVSQANPFLKDVSGSIVFKADEIELVADCDVRDGELLVLRNFLARFAGESRYESYLPYGTAAVVTFRDPSAASYLSFFGNFAVPSRFMQQQYAGLLWRLRDVQGLTQVTLAVTGYHQGVPNVAFGVWGDPGSLEKTFENLQVDFRRQRDTFLLNAAMDAAMARPGSEVPDLLTGGYLMPEPYGLFDHYGLQAGKLDTARLGPQDLDNPSYVTNFRDFRIRFLFPPVTDNDIKYRPELVNLDANRLKDNSYRMPYALVGRSLWICTDLQDLEALLERVGGASGSDMLANNSYFKRVRAGDRQLKIEVIFNIREIIDLGLLSPESSVEGWVKSNLFDLRRHDAASLTISPEGQNRVRVTLHLNGRQQQVASWP